jgi:hypothetical protein
MSGPFVGDEGWFSGGSLEGVPSFGTLKFANTVVFGKPFGQVSPIAGFERVAPHGTLQIALGGFSSGGKDFDTFFKHW